MAFGEKALFISQITCAKVLLSPLYYLKPGLSVWSCSSDGKGKSVFEVKQVQAYGFAENLHPPSSDSISSKKTCTPKHYLLKPPKQQRPTR